MPEFLKYTRRYNPVQYTLIAGVVFGFVFVAGFVMSIMQAAVASPVPAITGMFAIGHDELLGKALDPTSTGGYLLHNASVVIGTWLMGLSIVGPFMVLFENAMNISSFVARATLLIFSGNPDGLWLLAYIVPHGLVEIPAILLASGVGIYLARVMYGRVFKQKDIEILVALRRTFPFVVMALGMIVIAAVIEGLISPGFADVVVGVVYG